MTLHILHVEDDPNDVELVRRELEEGFPDVQVEVVETAAAFDRALERRWDLIICDHGLREFDSLRALQVMRAKALDVPFVIVSGVLGEEDAVAVMKAGAADYVPKASLTRLNAIVEREVRDASARAARRRLEEQLTRLQDLASLGGGVVDDATIAARAVEALCASLDDVIAILLRWDEESRTLVTIGSNAPFVPVGERIPMDAGAVGEAFTRRAPVAVEDYASFPRKVMDHSFIASVLAVPIVVSERGVGVIEIASKVRRLFGEEETALLRLFASQVGPLLEVGRLLHEAERRRRHEAALAGIGVQAVSTELIETLGERAASLMRAALEAHAAFVLARDELDGSFRIVGADGLDEKTRGVRFPGGQDDPLPRALRSAMTIVGERGSSADQDTFLIAPGARSGALVPVILDGQVVGAVAAMSLDAQAFDREAATLVLSFTRVIADFLRHRRDEARVHFAAMHDPVTSLPNRLLFGDRSRQVLLRPRSGGRKVGVVALALDPYDQVVQTFGRDRGDDVLREVAQRWSAAAGGSRTLARLEGGRFVLLAEDLMDAASVAGLFARLRGELRTPVRVSGTDVFLDVSAGFALAPDDGDDADTLLRYAERALQRAQASGGGTCLGHAADDETAGTLPLVSDLRRGIEAGELAIYAQPIIEIPGRSLVAAEALVRWRHPRRGLLLPKEFVPAAETSGAIRSLTHWVLRDALRSLAAWRALRMDTAISVNISTRDLVGPELPEVVRMSLEMWRIPARCLKLEVTESAMLAERGDTLRNLQRLHAMNVAISIDDFGTGYSSLARLRELPIDEVKIDRMFVAGILTDREDEEIVRSTIDLGHGLGVKLVAEGVESADVLARLAELGCDRAQGEFIAPPMPATDFLAWSLAYSPASQGMVVAR